MSGYQEQTGTRNDYIAIDSQKILSELKKGNFAISSSPSMYTPEIYTIAYISSIFNAKDAIEDFWNSCVPFVANYIKEFEGFPEPESISPDTSFLNDTQGNVKMTGYIISDGTQYIDSNGNVLGTLGAGVAVTAVAKTTDKKWIQIKTEDGQLAYVPYDSLSNKATAKTADIKTQTTNTNGGVKGFISVDGTEYIDSNGKVLGTLGLGAAVTAIAKTTDKKWIQIQLDNGQTAYVPYDNLSSKSSGSTTTVTTPQATTPRQVTPGVGKTTGTYNGMDYYFYEPAQDGTPKSLTIFFHGNGEDGGKLSKAASYGIGKQLASGQDFDGYVLVPHNNGKWDSKKINNLIDEISEKYNIDKNRISLAGYSNGANPVSELVRENPNKFSAVAFIGSYVDSDSTAKALVNTPTRFLTGRDNSGATKHSESMVAKIENAGGTSASMDVYKGYGHSNPFVTMLYNDGGLYEWLTSQSRAKTT